MGNHQEVGVLMGEPIPMDLKRDVTALRSASDTDRAFLAMMIPHHAAAIVMANAEERSVSNLRLKTMSQNIVATQAREIGEMRSLLART